MEESRSRWSGPSKGGRQAVHMRRGCTEKGASQRVGSRGWPELSCGVACEGRAHIDRFGTGGGAPARGRSERDLRARYGVMVRSFGARRELTSRLQDFREFCRINATLVLVEKHTDRCEDLGSCYGPQSRYEHLTLSRCQDHAPRIVERLGIVPPALLGQPPMNVHLGPLQDALGRPTLQCEHTHTRM
jgi:hypothetical protein